MRAPKSPCVYILATKNDGVLYTGVTAQLLFRVPSHREGPESSFTSRYGVYRLVWFEEYSYMDDAIIREKQIKKWNRAWKVRLIEKSNPEWKDLFEDMG